MDALLMCGGRGSRFDVDGEKPLYVIGGQPMVDRVRAALDASRVARTYAVVSPAAPVTRDHLSDLPTIETPGDGYVADLDRALDRVDTPVLSVAADLPLLEGDAIDAVLDAYDAGALTTCVPTAVKCALDVSVDGTLDRDGRDLTPTGVNVVDEGAESFYLTYDVRFAVNVNRLSDAEVAEALL